MRVGIVGTEISHVEHVIEYLNVARRQGDGARVVALSGGAGERNRELAAAGGIDLLVDEPADLLGHVDAVIVSDRDARLHRAHALPFLSAGLPVLVDKPFATTVDDAEAMIAVARAHGAPITSYSTLRYGPDAQALRDAVAGLGPIQAVVATGPADETSEYGGIHFYGIHPVDVAFSLVPGPVGPVRMERAADTVVATARVGDAHVTVNLVRPANDVVPFHALAIGRTGLVARTLTPGPHYVWPGLDEFFRMIATGRPPIDPEDLLRPVRFLADLDRALAADPR
ncbi:MAG TPA: Gfo/Idh/MocA family oxidoreductase [Actinocatenispora sp.]